MIDMISNVSHEYSWLEIGSGLKMYFLMKMGIFQLAMLVYQRVK